MLSYIKQRVSLKYILASFATIALVFTVLYFWLSRQEKQMIMDQVKNQAVILHKQIVLTREWVSDHNHILVQKKEGHAFQSLLREPEIQDGRGRIYAKITPSMLTRQLSDYAEKSHLYSFNLTNFHSLNPENRPDAFEIDALRLFVSGRAHELSRIETQNEKKVYRYAAPLPIRKSCLTCHPSMAQKMGGVGGCISVFIPFDQAQKAINQNNLFLFLTMTGLTLSIMVVLFFFTNRIIFTPVKEIQRYTQRIREREIKEDVIEPRGDELKEFANTCLAIDEKLKNRHIELEKKIQEATRDLYDTTLSLKQANEDLRALDRAKTEFFSDISHELRTPLTSIKGAADILARKSSCSDPVYLNIIKKNTDHLTRTIVDFRDYSKIEAGRLELDIRPESLGDIVREVMDARRAEAMAKGLTLVFEPEEEFEAPMDPYRIYQVLSNLISNAIKFSHRDGKIWIKIQAKDGELRVSVEDEGIGIDPAYHGVIFKKFHQAPRPRGTMARGEPHKAPGGTRDFQRGSSGIGLAICRGIVRAHGGSIRVKSCVGKGSRFIFTLPKHEI